MCIAGGERVGISSAAVTEIIRRATDDAGWTTADQKRVERKYKIPDAHLEVVRTVLVDHYVSYGEFPSLTQVISGEQVMSDDDVSRLARAINNSPLPPVSCRGRGITQAPPIRLQPPGFDVSVRLKNCAGRRNEGAQVPLQTTVESGPVLMIRSTKPYHLKSSQGDKVEVGEKFRRIDGLLGEAYTLRIDVDGPNAFDPSNNFLIKPSKDDQIFYFTTLYAPE